MEREISDFRQTRERQLQEQLMRVREWDRGRKLRVGDRKSKPRASICAG